MLIRQYLAPGGYVGRIDPDGKNVELFSIGFRNQFDIAFALDGSERCSCRTRVSVPVRACT